MSFQDSAFPYIPFDAYGLCSLSFDDLASYLKAHFILTGLAYQVIEIAVCDYPEGIYHITNCFVIQIFTTSDFYIKLVLLLTLYFIFSWLFNNYD